MFLTKKTLSHSRLRLFAFSDFPPIFKAMGKKILNIFFVDSDTMFHTKMFMCHPFFS